MILISRSFLKMGVWVPLRIILNENVGVQNGAQILRNYQVEVSQKRGISPLKGKRR